MGYIYIYLSYESLRKTEGALMEGLSPEQLVCIFLSFYFIILKLFWPHLLVLGVFLPASCTGVALGGALGIMWCLGSHMQVCAQPIELSLLPSTFFFFNFPKDSIVQQACKPLVPQ